MQLQSFAIPVLAGNGILAFQNHLEPMFLSHYREYQNTSAHSASQRGARAAQRVTPNSAHGAPGGQRSPAQRLRSPHGSGEALPGRGVRGAEEPSRTAAGPERGSPSRRGPGPARYKTAWFCNNLRALPNQRRRRRHVPAFI